VKENQIKFNKLT